MPLTPAELATLILHNNFTNEVEPDNSTDCAATGYSQIIIDGATNIAYVSAHYGGTTLGGQVRKFDATTGAYLGLLATLPIGAFSFGALVGSRWTGGGMFILNDPVFGKWLLCVDDPIYGCVMQAIALNATDSSGNPIATGTLTNQLDPMWDNTGSGNNVGCVDVDATGNVWLGCTDNAGPYAGIPRLVHIVLAQSGANVAIGYDVAMPVGGWNFNTLYAWTFVTGVRCDPVSGKLVVWGKDSGGAGIVARVDQASAFTILVSSGSLPTFAVPMQIAADGQYVAIVGTSTTLVKVQVSTLTVTQTVDIHTAYGIITPPTSVWYDSVNNFVWVQFQSTYGVTIFDLGNTTPSGFAQLLDPASATWNHVPTQVCNHGYGMLTVSPSGNYAVTAIVAGTPTIAGFIDFWGFTPALPLIIIGHALNLLSSHYNLS